MKNKKAFITFTVLSLVFFAAWIAFFVVTGLAKNGTVTFFETRANYLASAWTFDLSQTTQPLRSILAVSISGVTLVLVVVWVIVTCKKKFAKLAWYGIAIALIPAACVDYATGCDVYNAILAAGSGQDVFAYVMWICTLACGGLATIFMICNFIIGIVGVAKVKKEEAVVEQIDEALAPVAEEAPAEPEVVEEPKPEETPVIFEDAVVEPIPEFEAAPEPVEEPKPVEEVKEEKTEKESLADMLKEIVRDIVRDEIARNNANQPKEDVNSTRTITGATFGGPLVVQYFNGGINGVTPTPCNGPQPQVVSVPVEEPKPVVKEEPKPVVKDEPKPFVKAKEEPKPIQKPTPVVADVAPVVEPKVEEVVVPVTPVEEKKPIVRIPFEERIIEGEKDLQTNYNDLKNELLSWGLKSRVSSTGDTFRLHRKTYCKISVAGKGLKFHFALDPKDYEGGTYPVQDASDKEIYAEIPLVFKVKSGLSVRRCKELISQCCEKDGLTQGNVETVNWVKEIKATYKK